MKMRMKRLCVLGLCALALTACSEQDELANAVEESEPQELTIMGGVGNGVSTRVTDTTWDYGDAIGVFLDDNIINMRYSTKGDGEFTTTSENPYLTDDDTHTIRAYFPYNDKATEDYTQSFAFNSKATPSEQKSRDLMYATATVSRKNPCANLTFKRLMTRVVVNVKLSEDDGYTPSDIFPESGRTSRLVVQQFYSSFYFKQSTGEITIDTNSKTSYVISSGVCDTENNIYSFTLLLAPQNSASGLEYQLRTSDGNYTTFNTTLPSTTWEAGKTYTYNITLRKKIMYVSTVSVTAWDPTDEVSQEAFG